MHALSPRDVYWGISWTHLALAPNLAVAEHLATLSGVLLRDIGRGEVSEERDGDHAVVER